MTVTITGFGTSNGDAVDNWDRGFGGSVFAANQYVRIQGAHEDENVQLYSGWPTAQSAGNENATLVRNSGTEILKLTNFSWTINVNTTGLGENNPPNNQRPFVGGTTLANSTTNFRNHTINNAGIEWENGDILVTGLGQGNRFGIGSPSAANAGSIRGYFRDIRMQAISCRLIFQLGAFTNAEVTNPSIDDFTYFSTGARADANFPGAQFYEGFASGANGAFINAANDIDQDNGNFGGAHNGGDPAFDPTVLMTPNIRRLGVTNALDDFRAIFRHSVKSTPIIIVDPTFTVINPAVTTEHTEIIIDRNGIDTRPGRAGLGEFYEIFGSTSQPIPANTFVWFGNRFSIQPQTTVGDNLGGAYYVLNDQGTYSINDYRIGGITDDTTYTPVSALNTASLALSIFTQDQNISMVDPDETTTEQVYSVTDRYDNAGGAETGVRTLLDTFARNIVFLADGYDPHLVDDFNPRNDDRMTERVIRPTIEETFWLKARRPDRNAAYAEITLNDAAEPIYEFLRNDPTANHNPRKEWDATTITLGNLIASGIIRQTANPPTYNSTDTDAVWDIGPSHVVQALDVSNRAGGVLTRLDTINALNLEFQAGFAAITVPNLHVDRLQDLLSDLLIPAKVGGSLSGELETQPDTTRRVLRFEGVDVAGIPGHEFNTGITIARDAGFTIYGTNQAGDPYTENDFTFTGAGTGPGNNIIRGLPEVETVTLPAHTELQGWYYTTRTLAGTFVEIDIELDNEPIRIESETPVVFTLSTAGSGYRSVVWADGDIFTVYYKYDSRVQTAALPLDNITYQETVAKHTFGSGGVVLPTPTLIPATQTELAVQPANFTTDTYRFTDYNPKPVNDPLDNPVGALAIGTPSGGYSGNNVLNKDAEVSLALALLIGNDQDYMHKIVDLSRADSENDLVSFFTVLGGYSVRWNPGAITLATDQLTTDANQYRIQQQVANWEYDEITFPNTMDFALARTGAPEVISFEPGEASLQQVQSAAQTGIDASRTGGLVADVQNINRWMVTGDGGRFLGIKPRISEFNEDSDYDI